MAKWSRYNSFVASDEGSALFFNARTGALIRLSPERCRQIGEQPAEIPQDFLDFLLQQGFLVGDNVDEIQLIANAHTEARNERRVFSATIELTEACNFRCVYCYQAHAPEDLEDRAAEKIIHYLSRKVEQVHHLHVNWFGGEPLIRFEMMTSISRRLAEAARICGCSFSQFVTTNGYFVTHLLAKKLAELGIENVQITLDGDEDSHDQLRVLASGRGTYKKVLTGCENVVSAGMELMVRINVNRWNADRIDYLLSDLVSRGISPANTVIHAVRAIDHGNCSEAISSMMFSNSEFAEEWVRILRVIAEYGFGLPTLAPRAYNCSFDLRQTVMIGRDGNIRHCSSSDGRLAELTDAGEERNTTPLYDVIKARTPLDDPECRECKYLPMCMGGCSYLQELGREKCNPERYVLPELVRLTARQAETVSKSDS
jgi:uncharacterized protein